MVSLSLSLEELKDLFEKDEPYKELIDLGISEISPNYVSENRMVMCFYILIEDFSGEMQTFMIWYAFDEKTKKMIACDILDNFVLLDKISRSFVIDDVSKEQNDEINTVVQLGVEAYRMIFGDENEKKTFKYIKGKIGRGYVSNNGELAREFYSPLVPIAEGYDFISELAKLPVLEEVQPVQLEAPPISNTEQERAEAGQLEDKAYTITSLSRKLEQPNKTVKTVIERLAAGGFSIREEAPYTEDDYYAIQAVFSAKEAGELTLNVAIDEILADEAEYKKDFENFNKPTA